LRELHSRLLILSLADLLNL